MIISNILIMYKQLQPYFLTQDRDWSVKVHKSSGVKTILRKAIQDHKCACTPLK